VGEEFWDRAHPQELEAAREKMHWYVSFYNYFRPHQGIEGGIPAERFFGAAEAVKRMTEERIERNALQLALGETPRRTAFLVGQVGDRAVSLHGERGKLVMQTDEGVYEALGLEDLGMERKEAGDDGADGEGGGDGAGGGGDGDGDGGAGSGFVADGAGAAAVPPAAADAGPPAGGGGAGPVGPGERGGEAEGARHGHGDPVVVAGGEPEAGGAGDARGDGAADVAAVTDGALRDGGGAAQAAEEKGEGAAGDSRGGGPGGAEEEGGAAGAGSPRGSGAGGAAPDAADVEAGWPEGRCLPRPGSVSR
jgi:hypothetical protein